MNAPIKTDAAIRMSSDHSPLLVLIDTTQQAPSDGWMRRLVAILRSSCGEGKCVTPHHLSRLAVDSTRLRET